MHESERHGNGGAGGRGDEQQVGALALGVYTGLGPMAAGYALWTYAMSQPSAARLAPIAYATPLLSTLVLLASGERLGTLGLIGCGLIVACAAGVLADRGARPCAIGQGRRRPCRTVATSDDSAPTHA